MVVSTKQNHRFLRPLVPHLKLTEGDVIVVEGGKEEDVLAGDNVVRGEPADLGFAARLQTHDSS